MEVDGVSIHLLLDTAASGILLFESRIRDRLPQLISLGEREPIWLNAFYPVRVSSLSMVMESGSALTVDIW
jgi:hypothetical protein